MALYLITRTSWRLLSLILLFSALTCYGETKPAGWINSAPKDTNGRYTNLQENLDHGSFTVRLAFILRRLSSAFNNKVEEPKPQAIETNYFQDTLNAAKITWIGHSTFLVQMDGLTFLTDPIWSNTASPIPPLGPQRLIKPGIKLDDLPPIDFVIISHNHYDHMDIPTLRALTKKNNKLIVYVPLNNAHILRRNGIHRIKEMDWGSHVSHQNVDIYCLPAQHWSKRTLTDTRKALWASWAIIGTKRRFYFAGDTGYFDSFKSIGENLGPFDLAALPIGAYKPKSMMRSYHMNPEEAVAAAVDIQAKKAVAMHFGTFNLSDEPISEPPLRFKTAAAKNGLGKDNGWVLNIGETREF
tara:strand:- start:1134 stop:2198 length:1065 start_codon:yes stop_codon:yes gene_type:complete